MSQRFVGVTNLSLSDKSALRIAGMVENTGGWIDAPTANREDINDGKLFQIRATGLFKLADSLSVTGMAQVHRNDVGSLANGENGDVLDLLGARLAFDWGKYGLEMYSENILNDRGQNFPNPVQFATRAVPRSIGLKGSISF